MESVVFKNQMNNPPPLLEMYPYFITLYYMSFLYIIKILNDFISMEGIVKSVVDI
jgi:hypothetical protein